MDSTLNLSTLKAIIIDIDGTLWRGDLPLPGLSLFFAFLKKQRISFVIATNNTTETPTQYRQKLADFGVSIKLNQVFTGAVATAAYLKSQYPAGAKIYAIGLNSLHLALHNAGFVLLKNVDTQADVVVIGGDPTLTYTKLKYAALHVQRGAQFVGTNPDLLVPTEEGLIPEAGTTLVAIKAATGVSPTVIGKPNRTLFEMALAQMGSSPAQTAMLGDRLETDILGGQRVGLKTILVTTGVDNETTIAQKGILPDAVFSGLDTLTCAWQAQIDSSPVHR